jgi:NTE family protein
VLKALERAGIPIDAISGTSMGSLVGGLYAAGYSATDLEGLASEIEWPAMFNDAPDRGMLALFDRVGTNPTLLSLPLRGRRIGLPSGVVAGQHVEELFTRLTWPVYAVRDFKQLPIPFSAVATDLETGNAVVLDTGSLAEVMRASMSLPSIFAPANLHGRSLVDGGLSRNLPAKDVQALGAEVVICSDVSEPLLGAKDLHTILDVLTQAVSFHGNESTLEERRRCDVYIRPDLTGLDPLSFDRTSDWVARGDSATQLVSARLRELVTATGGPVATSKGIPQQRRATPVALDSVVVVAATPEARAFARATLGLRAKSVVDPDRMTRAVGSVYGSGLFETVTYGLRKTDSGTVATVRVQGSASDRVGFGFRYDDRYNAALLFNATVRQLLPSASTGRLSLRLGEQTRVAVDVARGGTVLSHWLAGGGASYLSAPIDFFEGSRRAAQANLRVTDVNVVLGGTLGGGVVAAQAKVEDAHASSAISAVDSSQRRTFGSAAALLWWDNMNEGSFPTRGTTLLVRYERAAGGGPSFSRELATGSAAVPITRRLSVLGRATFGASSRDVALPLHYRFFLGSLTPSAVLAESQITFAGLRPQERNDYAIAQVGASVQWEAVPNVFAILRADVGNVAPTVSDAVRSRIAGFAFSLGSRTIAGPVELSVHGRSLENTLAEFSVGHSF